MGLPIVSVGLYTILGLRAEEIESERLGKSKIEEIERDPIVKQILKNVAQNKLKEAQENKENNK
ncbi:hypothetical protein AF78_04280 [Aliarcobacter butzleri L353]|uniref:hypothetical protein n=1 Tax=Aliarcobacter butzleri TaxID=28197 RepID=UPI0006579622|nr:hypothetical protein [Aliarcobacter butzleri]KLE05990.1 hypothetical protein AF78_04280 [Aliarcobacter butzleri L353]